MTTVMVAYQSVSNESSPWSTVTDSITPGRRNPSLSSSQPQAAQGLPSPGRLGPGSLELCVCHRQLEVPRLARECGGIELSVPQNHCDQPTKVSPRRAASEPLARCQPEPGELRAPASELVMITPVCPCVPVARTRNRAQWGRGPGPQLRWGGAAAWPGPLPVGTGITIRSRRQVCRSPGRRRRAAAWVASVASTVEVTSNRDGRRPGRHRWQSRCQCRRARARQPATEPRSGPQSH